MSGGRACCDAASLVQQAQNTVEMPSRSSATKWWIPVVQQRTDPTPLRSCSSPSRSSTSPSWPSDKSQSREFRRDRDSTGSVPDKMADVTVVPVHRCTRTAEIRLYSKTMRSLSPDAQSREIGEHTCPPGLSTWLRRSRRTLRCSRRCCSTVRSEELASKLTECRDDERDRVKTHIPDVCPGGVPHQHSSAAVRDSARTWRAR